jgi:hypothetical protein
VELRLVLEWAALGELSAGRSHGATRAARPAQAREVREWARRLVVRVPSEVAACEQKKGGRSRRSAGQERTRFRRHRQRGCAWGEPSDGWRLGARRRS